MIAPEAAYTAYGKPLGFASDVDGPTGRRGPIFLQVYAINRCTSADSLE
jgi:hypothetical protein